MDRARVREIFADVCESDPAHRRALVVRLSAGDDAVRDEVFRLLGAVERAGDYLSVPTVRASRIAEAGPAPEETQVGPYKLLERIGEGGFGEVYMAEQTEPVRRKVAVKIIKPGMDSRRIVARFEAERQALAVMEHPNIARVFDAGATARGRPYFAMELVRGIAITKYCDENRLTPRERLELLVPVCKAVQHAHSKGVIHRDIKPGNVLVTLHDGVPVPKVIDFGVAKAVAQPLTDKTLFTEFRQMVGTPAYMSPEQAEMSGLDIDTRSDVYSLGVLLYELLTGGTPFEGSKLLEAGIAEIQRIIREVEPPKPSTRLSKLGETLTTVADRRRTEPERLGKIVRGELDWIVMKAMEKDRRRRYATADALADDLRRFLAGDPVEAAPPGRAYRVRKFVRRNRLAVISVSLVLLALVSGLSLATWGFATASRERDEKELARRGEADQRAEADLQRRLAEGRERESRRLAYSANIAAAQSALRAGEVAEASARLRAAPPELRGWEWKYLSFLSNPSQAIPRLAGYEATPSSNRKWLAVYKKDDPTIRIVDIETLDDVSSTLVGTGDRWAMPSDAADRLSVYRREAGILEMWNVNAVAPSWHRAAGLRSGTFIGSQLVAIDGDSSSGPEILADAETGRDVRPFPAGWQIGPGSTKFLGPAGSYDALADSVTGEGYTGAGEPLRVILSPTETTAVSVSLTADSNSLVRLTSRRGDRLIKELTTVWGRVEGIDFRPDGEKLFIEDRGEIQIFDPSLPLERHTLVVPGLIRNMFTGPLGSPWLFLDLDGSLTRVPAYGTSVPWRFAAPFQSTFSARYFAISPDGRTLAAAEWGVISVWDVLTGTPLWRKSTWSTFLRSVTFSPDGALVAAHTPRGTVTLFDARTGVVKGSTPPRDEIAMTGLAFSARADRLFVADDRGGLAALDPADLGATPVALPGHGAAVEHIAASPCGRWLASISSSQGPWRGERTRGPAPVEDMSLKLLNVRDGSTRAIPLAGHVPACVAFSPDGERMWIGTTSGTILVAPTGAQAETVALPELSEPIRALTWSHDGSRCAASAGDAVHIFDTATWSRVCVLPNRIASAVAFGTDDRWLVAGGCAWIDVYEVFWPSMDVLRRRDISGLALNWLQSIWKYEWTDEAVRTVVEADTLRSPEVRSEALRLVGVLGNNGPQLNNAALIALLPESSGTADLSLAEAGVRAAIAAAPDAPNFRFTLGSLLIVRGDWEGARSAMQEGIVLLEKLGRKPPIEALLSMAIVHGHSDELEEVRRLLNRIDEAPPGQAQSLSPRMQSDLQRLRARLRDEDSKHDR